MGQKFNDLYIDCKFACLFNVLTFFDISPLYLLANNYYFVSDKISDINFLDYSSLIASANLATREIAVIDSIRDIHLKAGEIVMIKGIIDGEIANHKCNFLITEMSEDSANLIWRVCSHDGGKEEYGIIREDLDRIERLYCNYLDKLYFSGQDIEPTITYFSRKETPQCAIPESYFSYRVFQDNKGLIKQNGNHLLSFLLSEKNIEEKLNLCAVLKSKKIVERYKIENGIGISSTLNILNRQINILEDLPLHFLRHKEEKFIRELCFLEDEIFIKYDEEYTFNSIVNQCIQVNDNFKTIALQQIVNGHVLTKNKQNNSMNGIIMVGNKKCFYKAQEIESHLMELCGYYQLHSSFPVPELLFAVVFNDFGVIIYEYDDSVGPGKGLLNDYLVSDDSFYSLEFLEYIKSNYCKVKMKNSYPMQKFFEDRVEKRLKKYLDYSWVEKKVDIGLREPMSTKDIIAECALYFKTQRTYKCVLSHGDLNTMNIGTKPIFFDFVTSGYNYLDAEVAVFSISLLFMDLYYSPKYHMKSYQNHEKICGMVPNVQLEFFAGENTIKIKSFPKTEKKRKSVVKLYLQELEYDNSTLVYYIIMRFLTIFDIEKYEMSDKMYTLYLVHFFYHQMKRMEFSDIIDLIETI